MNLGIGKQKGERPSRTPHEVFAVYEFDPLITCRLFIY